MNRQQAYLLQMMKEIHDICVRNGIEYFIQGGTLIGAIRNGGFLPWDDDVDIVMTYENWLKFKEVCKTQLPENRYLGAPDLSNTYHHLIPRYTSCDTTAIHQCQSLHDDPAGEVVDIFIIDPIGEGDEAYEAYLKDLYLYSLLVNYSNTSGYRFGIDPEQFKEYLRMIHEQGQTAVAKIFEEKLASHFVDDGDTCILRWQGVPAKFKRSWYTHAILVDFEDTQLMAPAGYNGPLSTYFGQEWPEVPGVLSPSKHDAASSLDFPYTEALQYYKPKYDRAKLLSETEERRYIYLKYAPEENEIEAAAYAKKATLYKAEVEKMLSAHGAELERAVEELDADTLCELLKDYMARQASVDMVGARGTRRFYRFAHPIYIEVPDVVFEGALVAFMQTDRMRKAVRMLQVREDNHVPLTPFMEKMKRAIRRFDDAADAYFSGDYEDAYKLALSLYEDGGVPHPAELIRLMCASAQKQWLATDDATWRKTFEKYLGMARDAYPEDGTFAKFEADLMMHDGDSQGARDLYLRAAESTRNGLALRDIASATGYHPSWLRQPKWSEPAGVPRWDGPTPEPLPAGDTKSAVSPVAHDDPQRYVLGLLTEVCSLCESAGIPYVLTPKFVQAFEKQGLLPDGVEGYGVVMKPHDVKHFIALVDKAANSNRSLRFGGDALGLTHGISYVGLDSTYMNALGDYDEHACLSVSIMPLEAPEYSSQLRALAHYWREGSTEGGLKGRMASAYAKARGIKAHSAESAQKIFDLALDESEKSSTAGLWHNGEMMSFDSTFIDSRNVIDVHDSRFVIPKDVDAYLKAFPCAKAKRSFQIPAGYMCSTLVSAKDLAGCKEVVVPLSERYARLLKNTKAARKIRTRFQRNFDQVKLAVQVKSLADELLPQKDRIMRLHAEGSIGEVRSLLAGYIALYNKYSRIGNLEFDADIYRIMLEVRG